MLFSFWVYLLFKKHIFFLSLWLCHQWPAVIGVVSVAPALLSVSVREKGVFLTDFRKQPDAMRAAVCRSTVSAPIYQVLEVLPFQGVVESQAWIVWIVQYKVDRRWDFTDFETKPEKAMQTIENIPVAIRSCPLLLTVPMIMTNQLNVMVIMLKKLQILIKSRLIFGKNKVWNYSVLRCFLPGWE